MEREYCKQPPCPVRDAPHRRAASGQLSRSAQKLDGAAVPVRVLLLHRGHPRADHRLRRHAPARRQRLEHRHRLARGRAQSCGRDHVHPVARTRAFRAASAAVDDHAARLARTGADLQGPAGAAQGQGPGDVWLPRLPAAAGGRHPAVQGRVRSGGRGPGGARGNHARSRAALQQHLRPRAGLRKEGREGDQESRQPQRYSLQGVAPGLSGRRQSGGDRDRTCHARRQRAPDSRRPRALARLSRRHGPQHPGRARRVADGDAESAGPRRPQDVEVLRQHHRAARRSGLGREETEDDADRSGARAAHRPGRSRQMSGLGSSQDLLGRGHSRLGATGLPHGRHRLPRLQEASRRRHRGGDHGDPRARGRVRGESRPRARHHRGRLREGARRGAADARGCAYGDGHELPMKPELKLVENTGSQLEAEALVAEPPPQQSEMHFAVVEGEPVTELPRDLYIPPDALQVFLEAFEGPLDLLLYLIRKQNLDILDIPIAEITRQYMQYIELMTDLQLELAGEYLLMAAMLAEIKSRMLLPRPALDGQEEDDPRAELVRRLQEYERFKKAAEDIDRLTRMERDTLPASADLVERKVVKILPQVTLQEMLVAFKDVLSRAELRFRIFRSCSGPTRDGWASP